MGVWLFCQGQRPGVFIQDPYPLSKLPALQGWLRGLCPLLGKLGPWGLGWDGGGPSCQHWGRHSRGGSPQAHSSGHPSLHPCRPTCLTQHLSAGSPSTALRKQEERGRETERQRETEGGGERGPLCPVWLLSRPRAPTATPPPSWHRWATESEGGGGEPERGAVGPHTRLSTLGPLPPQPPLPPQGVSGQMADAGSREVLPS